MQLSSAWAELGKRKRKFQVGPEYPGEGAAQTSSAGTNSVEAKGK